jgi:hypothetical protein
MLLILVTLMVLVSQARGVEHLTINDEDVASIDLTVGQSCTIEVVSDGGTLPYIRRLDPTNFSLSDLELIEIKPEAGAGASVAPVGDTEYQLSAGAGMVAGVHFVFGYTATSTGQKEVELRNILGGDPIDSIVINVTSGPVGTAFTYQGRLIDTNSVADSLYDFQFMLYDSPSAGNLLVSAIEKKDIDVIDGYFTVELDFNDPCAFNGEARWLQINVRPGDSNDPNAFIILSPRQEVTPTPYALNVRVPLELSHQEAGPVIMATSNANDDGIGVYGEATGGSGHGVYGKATGDDSSGVHGEATGEDGTGVLGYASGDASHGVQGSHIDSRTAGRLGGFSYGVWGRHYDSGNNGYIGSENYAGYFAGDTVVTGSVGIGTENPLHDLHVCDSAGHAYVLAESESGYAFFIADGSNNSGLTIKENGTTKANVYWNTADDCLSLAYGSTDRLVVKGDNVGIGTTAPGSRLDIKASSGTSAGGLRITSSSNDNRVITLQDATPGDQGMIAILAGGSNKIVLRANGNTYFDGGKVGIGTASPGAKLDVSSPGASEDAIIARGSSGHEIFEVTQDGLGNGKVFVRDASGGTKIQLAAYGYSLLKGGNVGIGDVGIPLKKLVVRGNILVKSESTGADVLELGQGLDYAEGFDVTDSVDIEPGTVLVIDSENPGKLTVSRSEYDSKVAGIVAGGEGLGSGVRLGVGQFDYDVALAGRVYCKVDATEAAVQAGDQLTTSGTAGYAMKATDYERARGAVLGKAMESLAKGQEGQILVLVTLQ